LIFFCFLLCHARHLQQNLDLGIISKLVNKYLIAQIDVLQQGGLRRARAHEAQNILLFLDLHA
jgi:hypothetical protein